MNAATLKALKDSIEHWKRDNVGARHPKDRRIGAYSCALCQAFPSCFGCPVDEKTWSTSCEGTPYKDAFEAGIRWQKNPTAENKAIFHAAARREVKFLESLLPKPSKKTKKARKK